jgi:hypothetical protein
MRLPLHSGLTLAIKQQQQQRHQQQQAEKRRQRWRACMHAW